MRNPGQHLGKILALFTFSLLVSAPAGAQVETQFSAYGSSAAPCPSQMPAAWYDVAGRNTFWGTSFLRASDGTGSLYYFWGTTLDYNWKAEGYHRVFAYQCADAQVQRQLGIPAIIKVLSNPQITFIGIADAGSGCPGREDTEAPDYDPYGDEEAPTNGGPSCGGGGGGTGGGDPGSPPADGGGGSGCSRQSITIELSDDNGATWYTWWAGEALVCG